MVKDHVSHVEVDQYLLVAAVEEENKCRREHQTDETEKKISVSRFNKQYNILCTHINC